MKQDKTLLKLLMLPKADLDIIRKAKEDKAGEGIGRVNDHLTPIMVLYGQTDMVESRGSPDHIQESDISMLYYLSHSHFI